MSHNVSLSGGRSARRSFLNVRAAGTALALALAPTLGAAVIDFSDVPLTNPPVAAYGGPGGGVYYNGSDRAGFFTSGGASFNNNYEINYGSWGGFAYSNTTDTTTGGWSNQYSAYNLGAGTGTYAVAYYDAYTPTVPTISFGGPVALESVWLTNTTWAALDMADGSAFSKMFGGVSGEDPDFFKVIITGRDAFGASTGAIEFYLADYRFTKDYIVDEWTQVDLSGLGGNVWSIQFGFESSDVGDFGINTPTYVAIDNLSFTAVPEPSAFAAFAGLGVLGFAGLRRRNVRR